MLHFLLELSRPICLFCSLNQFQQTVRLVNEQGLFVASSNYYMIVLYCAMCEELSSLCGYVDASVAFNTFVTNNPKSCDNQPCLRG